MFPIENSASLHRSIWKIRFGGRYEDADLGRDLRQRMLLAVKPALPADVFALRSGVFEGLALQRAVLPAAIALVELAFGPFRVFVEVVLCVALSVA